MIETLTLNPAWATLLAAALVVGAGFGLVAAATRYCHMGAVADWVYMGDKGRLRAWMLSLAVLLLGVTLVEFAGWIDLDETRAGYRMAELPWLRYALGGLLFGIGMCLAGGCPTKTLVNIGQGNLRSLYAYALIGVVALILLKWPPARAFLDGPLSGIRLDLSALGSAHQDLGALLESALPKTSALGDIRLLVGLLAGTALLAWAAHGERTALRRADLIGGVLIGVAVLAAWLVSGSPWGQTLMTEASYAFDPPKGIGTQALSFITPASESLDWLSSPGSLHLVSFGMAAMLGVIAGAAAWFVARGEWRLGFFSSWREFGRYTLGGTLMGIGGIIAMGCSVGQGLSGASTLAVGSLIATVGIILGALITLKLWFYRVVHEAEWRDGWKAVAADFRLLPRATHPFDGENGHGDKSSPCRR